MGMSPAQLAAIFAKEKAGNVPGGAGRPAGNNQSNGFKGKAGQHPNAPPHGPAAKHAQEKAAHHQKEVQKDAKKVNAQIQHLNAKLSGAHSALGQHQAKVAASHANVAHLQKQAADAHARVTQAHQAQSIQRQTALTRKGPSPEVAKRLADQKATANHAMIAGRLDSHASKEWHANGGKHSEHSKELMQKADAYRASYKAARSVGGLNGKGSLAAAHEQHSASGGKPQHQPQGISHGPAPHTQSPAAPKVSAPKAAPAAPKVPKEAKPALAPKEGKPKADKPKADKPAKPDRVDFNSLMRDKAANSSAPKLDNKVMKQTMREESKAAGKAVKSALKAPKEKAESIATQKAPDKGERVDFNALMAGKAASSPAAPKLDAKATQKAFAQSSKPVKAALGPKATPVKAAAAPKSSSPKTKAEPKAKAAPKEKAPKSYSEKGHGKSSGAVHGHIKTPGMHAVVNLARGLAKGVGEVVSKAGEVVSHTSLSNIPKERLTKSGSGSKSKAGRPAK